MNKSYTPVNIPTFVDGESMDEVRVKTINPLTAEANKLGIKMNSLSNTVISHANKISALEAGGGGGSGGSVDLGPLTTRVTNAERDIDNLETGHGTLSSDSVTIKGQIVSLQNEDTAIKTRVTALEAGGGSGGGSTTFTGLLDTPSALLPDMVLKVNPAGTAIILDPHTHQKVDARQVMYSWDADDLPSTANKVIGQDKVAQRSFFISATSATTRVNTYKMPGISNEGVEPTSTEVNGGRVIIFSNTGGSDFILDATDSGLKIVHGITGAGVDSITVAAGKYCHIMAVCRSNNAYKNYHVVAAGDTSAFT